jgi:chromosome segregation ATPase
MDASYESQQPPLLQALEAEARGRVAQLDELLAEATRKLTVLDEKIASAAASATAVREKQDVATAALTEIQSKSSEIAAVSTQAIAAKTQIADDQAVIATKSDHIEQAQAHADKVRGDLDRALTAATQQVTEAEGLKSRAQSIADTAAGLLVEVKTLKATAETESAAATWMSEIARHCAR